ncbi:MAG: PqqD family protein [Novosphingobium sp.]
MSALLAKRPDRFVETAIDGEIVLLDLSGGTFFSLTGTAARIWPLINGTRSRAALLAELATAHDAPQAEISADLDVFLGQLVEAGFVAGD